LSLFDSELVVKKIFRMLIKVKVRKTNIFKSAVAQQQVRNVLDDNDQFESISSHRCEVPLLRVTNSTDSGADSMEFITLTAVPDILPL